MSAIVFDGGPGAAQTVLDAVSSSLITVTSLTFSLTVVTLQLASSQFSPRLLRTFTSDLFVQVTLAVFLATFVYSLAVLRLVRSEDGQDPAFVPRLSVSLAFVLVVASVFMLVLFLAHLTRTIRVETMLGTVHDEASATLRTTLGASTDTAALALPEPPPGTEVTTVRAASSGLVTGVDDRSLLRAAVAQDLVVLVDVRPGDHVVRGVPVARAWRRRSAGSTAPGDPDPAPLAAAVRCGPERTAAQDIGFGLRQISDVATKSLSPGINDPTTAVHAIGHLAALLCDLADHDLGPRAVRDEDDVVRLVLARPAYAELVEAAIQQPRRYGAGDPQVVSQLYRLLEALAHRVPDQLRPVVADQLRRLGLTASEQDFDDVERRVLRSLEERVRVLLGPAAG